MSVSGRFLNCRKDAFQAAAVCTKLKHANGVKQINSAAFIHTHTPDNFHEFKGGEDLFFYACNKVSF